MALTTIYPLKRLSADDTPQQDPRYSVLHVRATVSLPARFIACFDGAWIATQPTLARARLACALHDSARAGFETA